LLALRPYGGNTICLAMRPRNGKHLRQMDYDASNFITLPITPHNGTAVQHISIGLINCQSIYNMDIDALVITETWLTGNVSDHNIVGEVTLAG